MTYDSKLITLDYQLCFAVYATSNAFVRAYNTLLDAFGLTYPAYLVMLAAWEKDGQTIGEIAEKLHLPERSVVPVIQKLEAQGYLLRRVSVDGDRQTRVTVTTEGNNLRDDVARIRGEIGCMIGLKEEKLLSMRSELMEVLTALEDEIARLKPAKYSYL